MKIKIKKEDVPVTEFKVDKTKLVPCYIPEFDGETFIVHALLSLILSNADFDNGTIYNTRQMSEELSMVNPADFDKTRKYMETHINEYCYRASEKGLFQYEYLGDDRWDYGHYIRFYKSPKSKKEKL